MNISELSEFQLIARLTAGLTAHLSDEVGVGDDCALLDLGGDELLLATCDSQVEGIHFTLQTSTPEQVGQKALAINLSDIAAMGGVPRYALVSLLLPPTLSVEVLDGIYAGLRAEAQRYGTAIVGGNVAGTGTVAQLALDITLLGTVKRGSALLRSGAHPGDILCVTGSLGDSGAGLQTFLHPTVHYSPQAQQMVRQRHTAPTPRVSEGQVLSRLGPEKVTALLDVSDGLSGDLVHLCERSHCGARIELAALPLSPALQTIAAELQQDPLALALHSGEDYELLFAVAPAYFEEVRAAVVAHTGTPVTAIGTFLPLEKGVSLLYPDGQQEKLVVQSWDHLKKS